MNAEDKITIRVAILENAEKIYSIMQNVYNELRDKSTYVCGDLEYVKEQL